MPARPVANEGVHPVAVDWCPILLRRLDSRGEGPPST